MEEKALIETLQKELSRHQTTAMGMTAAKAQESAAKVKEAQDALSEFYLNKAKCPSNISGKFFGIRKNAHQIQIGCAITTDSGQIIKIRVTSYSPEAAATLWNEGKFDADCDVPVKWSKNKIILA